MTTKQHDSGFSKIKLSSSINIGKYLYFEKRKDKVGIADFIYERFYERHIRPLRLGPNDVELDKENMKKLRGIKNGFSIMANCCLMIESLESFHRGWKNSKNKSELSFCNFFDRATEFSVFKGYSSEFYKNIRCGILHQAESTGGWRIIRKGQLFDDKTLTINATKFLEGMDKYLKRYQNELLNSNWSDEIWKNLRKKMKNVIKNCKR